MGALLRRETAFGAFGAEGFGQGTDVEFYG